jgi:hypothetical protein
MVVDRSKDYIQQLANYIKKNLSKGYTLDSLKISLLNQGYSRITVNNAVELANSQLAAQVPPVREKPEITYKAFPEDFGKKGFFKRLFERIFG